MISSLPDEILKKVKLLELSTRKQVNNLLAGEYRTALKGSGMEFAEFREYVAGDDVRSISWTLTARTGKPYIKKFDEERELEVIVAADVSGSTEFGSGVYLKGEAITHLVALIAFSAVRNKDEVGLLLFSDEVEHFVPPTKGRGNVHRILRDLLYFKPQSKGTRISAAIDYLKGVLKKKAMIFILSDFMDEGFEHPIKSLGRKHDVVAVWVQDPVEKSFPSVGLIDLEDAETGESFVIDSDSTYFQSVFAKKYAERQAQIEKTFRQNGIDFIQVSSRGAYVDPLVEFFRARSAGRSSRGGSAKK